MKGRRLPWQTAVFIELGFIALGFIAVETIQFRQLGTKE